MLEFRDIFVANPDYFTMGKSPLSMENLLDYPILKMCIRDREKAREEKKTLTIEFLMGSPDDRDALFFYNGVMEKLQEYFDDGTLVCTSGKLTFDDTAVMRSGRNTAKNDMAEILSQSYTEGAPDIICTGADDLALGAVDALEDAGHVSGEDGWPMITGGGCEAEAVTAAIQGKIEDDLSLIHI